MHAFLLGTCLRVGCEITGHVQPPSDTAKQFHSAVEPAYPLGSSRLKLLPTIDVISHAANLGVCRGISLWF